jgi:hypothetical protein
VVLGANPLGKSEWYQTYTIRDLDDGRQEENIFFQALHNRRASNLSLLGINGNDAPPWNYRADFELDLIYSYADDLPKKSCEYMIQSIVEDTLQVPNLNASIRKEFEWLNKHIGFAISFRNAWEANNYESYSSVLKEWKEWYVQNENHNRFLTNSAWPRTKEKPFPKPIDFTWNPYSPSH